MNARDKTNRKGHFVCGKVFIQDKKKVVPSVVTPHHHLQFKNITSLVSSCQLLSATFDCLKNNVLSVFLPPWILIMADTEGCYLGIKLQGFI